LAGGSLAAVLEWTEADWDRVTRGTAARRARLAMFLRNAAIAAGNAPSPALRPALERLAAGDAPEPAQAARWALAQYT